MESNVADMHSERVQIDVSADGETVWVNVRGECRFRAGRCESVEVTDARPQWFLIEHDRKDPDVLYGPYLSEAEAEQAMESVIADRQREDGTIHGFPDVYEVVKLNGRWQA